MIGRWIFVRDGRLSARTKLALVAVFVAALIALLPLRLALGWIDSSALGISARAVEGSAWSGTIGDLRAGPLPLGTLDAGVRPLPLLIGRPELWLRRGEAAGAPSFRAVVSGGDGWVRLRDVNGSVPMGELESAEGSLPIAAIGFADFRLAVDEGRCRDAGGTVTLSLASLSLLMPVELAMSGKARCDGGALYVPMSGPTGMEKLLLRVEADGRWTGDLVLTGLPVEVTGPLLDLGFSGRPGGIGLRASGRL